MTQQLPASPPVQAGGVAAIFDPSKFEELTQEEQELVTIPGHSRRASLKVSPESYAGLGAGIGGQLARSALVTAGHATLVVCERTRARPETPAERPGIGTRWGKTAPLTEGPEPPGIFGSLVLSDSGSVPDEDLEHVRAHRWNFPGADSVAGQGKSFCFFVRCLLDLQRNVQMEETGEVLDAKLLVACRLLVQAQCREGRQSDMYQLLTHFLCNSRLFAEWNSFLQDSVAKPGATAWAAMVPIFEQVWIRYCRFAGAVHGIFKPLDHRVGSWRHRLPKVEALLCEHMRKRCFSSTAIFRHEAFTEEKCTNATVREIKRTFGFNM